MSYAKDMHSVLGIGLRRELLGGAAMTPICLVTFQDCIDQGYAIRAFCHPCQRSAVIDLQELVRAGFGGRSYIGRKWRCTRCGAAGHIIVWPPAYEQKAF